MKRYALSGVITLLLATALWAGSRPLDMFSPPGLACQYVRAVLEADEATAGRCGSVDPASRVGVLEAVDGLVTRSGREVLSLPRPTTTGDLFLQRVSVQASDGTSVTLLATIDMSDRKVVGLRLDGQP